MVNQKTSVRRLMLWLSMALGSAEAGYVIPQASNTIAYLNIQDYITTIRHNYPNPICDTFLTTFDTDYVSKAVFAGDTRLHYYGGCSSGNAYIFQQTDGQLDWKRYYSEKILGRTDEFGS